MTVGASSTAPSTAQPLGSPLYRLNCGCELDTNGYAPVLRHAPACAAGPGLLEAINQAIDDLAGDEPSISAIKAALDHARSLALPF